MTDSLLDAVASHGELAAVRNPAMEGCVSSAGQTMQATRKSYHEELINLRFRRQVLEQSISVVEKAMAQIDNGTAGDYSAASSSSASSSAGSEFVG